MRETHAMKNSGLSATSNGHGGATELNELSITGAPVPDLQDTAVRGSERMPGVLLRLQTDLVEFGRQFAVASGTPKARAEDLQVLRDHSDAIANESVRPDYDPNKYPHDRILEDEFQKHLRDREEEEIALKIALATLTDSRSRAASARGKVPSLPKDPTLAQKSMAILALTATIAPLAHDGIWTMEDEVVSWSMSLATGVVVGMFIVWTILDNQHQSQQRSIRNWMGLIGGLGLGFALFLLRVNGAEDWAQVLFALGLSLVEIFIVIILEAWAADRRRSMRERTPLALVADEEEALANAQQAVVDRHQNKISELSEKVDAHGRYVEERYVRANYNDQIRETARKAVENGYYKGIAENQGRGRGVRE